MFQKDFSLYLIQLAVWLVAIPLIVNMLLILFNSHELVIHLPPLQTTMESLMAFMSLMTGAFIYANRQSLSLKPQQIVWFSSGLLSIGLFGIFNALTDDLELQTWFLTSAMLSGGILVGISVIPNRLPENMVFALPFVFLLIFTILFSSDLLPSSLLLDASQPSFLAKTLILIGSFGFGTALTGHILDLQKNNHKEHSWVAIFCLVLIVSNFAVIFTNTWGLVWWWWKLFRLLAYGMLLYFFYQVLKNIQIEISLLNEQLSTQNMSLEKKMVLRQQVMQAQQVELELQRRALEEAALILIGDIRGNLTYVNHRFTEIMGYQSKYLYGKKFETTFFENHEKNFMEHILEELKANHLWRGEICHYNSRKEYVWLETTIVPFGDDKENVYQFMAVCFDITDRKKAEREAKRAYQEIQTSEEELRQNSEELKSINEQLIQSKYQSEQQSRKLEIQKKEIEEKQWISDGVTSILLFLQRQQDLKETAYQVLSELTEYTNGLQSALYLVKERKDERFIEVTANYGFSNDLSSIKTMRIGEGLVGTCIKDGKRRYFPFLEVEKKSSTSTSEIFIRSLVLEPIWVQNEVIGLIEISSNRAFTTQELQLIRLVAERTGMAFVSMTEREKRTELFKELQENNRQLRLKEEELTRTAFALQNLNESLEERIALRVDEIQQQKDIIEQKNKKITDSIRYALQIQEIILPEDKLMQELFAEYFVIFKPKDMVSGDFYWAKAIGKTKFIAVVDCTGHGVPGAFVSMIAHSLLNEVIIQQKVYEPRQILSLLHQNIQSLLKQRVSRNTDGFDIALCKIDFTESHTFLIDFAGAKRPLWYIRNGVFEELRGNRKSIGGIARLNEDEFLFESKKIELHQNDVFYLSSDGLTDQPDLNREKFSTQRLKGLLAKNYYKPLHEQRLLIYDQLKTHLKSTEQRDDITLLGIKL